MFQISQEQFAALRRVKVGDGLIATFSSGPAEAEWNENQTYVTATDPLGNATRFGFDKYGFLSAIASPLGRVWQMENNAEGQTAVFRNPAGHQLGIAYTAAGQIEGLRSNGRPLLWMHYNEKGQKIAQSYPDGSSSAIEYTPWGEPAATIDRTGRALRLEYDWQRRLSAIVDGKGSRTVFLYSKWKRPDRVVYPNQTSEEYSYNDKGQVTGIVTGDVTVQIQPGEGGRPESLLYSDGTSIQCKFDDKGRMAEASLPDLPGKFAWNEAGGLVSEQSGEAKVQYEYDEAGRLIAMTLPSGEILGYKWDADSRLTLIRDWNGGEHRIEYAPDERSYQLTSPSGLGTLTTLDDLGNPERISVTRHDNPLYAMACAYDEENRLGSLRDSVFGHHGYRYDAEGQLLAVETGNAEHCESFSYDAAGNPANISGQPAQYDAANQLLALGGSSCHYDLRGNLIRIDTAAGTWRFAWSARNLLLASQSPDGAITHYEYDGFGRRIRKQRPGLTVDFTWAGEQMVSEVRTTASGVTRRDYLYFPGTFTPLAMRVDGQVYTCHTDPLGTPRMIAAPDGSPVWLADYSGFGVARVKEGSTLENPLRLPGQYFDEETGLHYNRFRYYAPQLGRYISRDPMGFIADTNFYRYAGNNPINQADPMGLFWGTVAAVAAGIAVGAVVIATAPVSLPAAILLAGAAGGAVAGGLNQALNEQNFCLPCILKSIYSGALAGAVSAIPFALLPVTAGVAAFAGAGALGGAAGYTTNFLDGANPVWSWAGLAVATGLGAALGAGGKYIGDAMTGGPADPQALDPHVAANIKGMAKGSRPDPSTYMSKEQIDTHLAKFDNGASRFMTQNNLAKYGPSQRDGTSFMMPSDEADAVIANAGGDPAKLESALGLPPGTLNGNPLVRVDVANPRAFGLRVPSGNEAGANDLWIPGGKLPDGTSEAVIDLGGAPPGSFTSTPVIP